MLLNSPSSHHFLLLLLLTFSSYTPCHPSLLPSDARALMDFKSHADPHNKLKFNPALTHCKWAGVHCGSGARVTRLVIEHLGLAGGFVHDSLTRLDQLRVLSLQNNSLSGPIPDLSGLVNLKSLFLGFNLFSGEFPPSILSLHRLRTLDLSRNNLTGELPSWLTRMDRLYTIKLEFNRFNGSIPAFNQSTLLFFNATGNNLSGPIPVTPVMTQFKPSSFALNPALCGEIIHKECHSKRPFFGVMTPPVASPVAPPPRTHVGLGQNEQMHGVELAQPRGGHHKSVAVILGFSVGVLVLIGSLLCFIMGVRKQRSGNQMGGQQGMAGDEVVQAAEAVKRAEEEVEEKVKSAQQQGIKGAAKSGSLVFCAGEAQLYTMEQLMRASAELIGRGTLGSTYKAVLDNRLIVCVKRLDGSKFMGAGKDGFERHMEAVGGLRHPNLVALRAYFQAAEERLLVYDYQPNGSVFSLIHGSKSSKAKPLHWTSCLKIAEDVAQGLSYIHQAWRLVHGNLKSTNVLLGSDFEACLTDYSLSLLADPAVFEDDPDSSGYWAPELRKPDSQATSKSDVYAFGVLLLELLTGKAPSEHPYLTPNDIVKWVRLTRDGEVSGSEENELAMLLEVAIACSVASPEQRPNMWQVLKMLQQIKEAVLIEENELGFDRSEGNVS